jgi:hypothetical protein
VEHLEKERFIEEKQPLKAICQICFEEKFVTMEFPKRKVTDRCDDHELACSQCVARTIKAAIENGSWEIINCPLCPNRLDSKDITEFAATEDREM